MERLHKSNSIHTNEYIFNDERQPPKNFAYADGQLLEGQLKSVIVVTFFLEMYAACSNRTYYLKKLVHGTCPNCGTFHIKNEEADG